jgi:hypothetical protein
MISDIWNLTGPQSSSPSGMKYSISICSNSLDRKMKLRGVISFLKALPIWAIPKGIYQKGAKRGGFRSENIGFMIAHKWY